MGRVNQALNAMRNKRASENGNMFIFIFMMFLLMVLVVGVAIDTAGTVAARQGTQNALTSSTVAAATQLNNRGEIDFSKAQNVAYELYGKNRQNVPMLRCANTADANKVGGTLRKIDGCGFVVKEFSVTDSGRQGTPAVKMTTYECSPNTFMEMAVEEFCFEITSVGRLSSSVERL